MEITNKELGTLKLRSQIMVKYEDEIMTPMKEKRIKRKIYGIITKIISKSLIGDGEPKR